MTIKKSTLESIQKFAKERTKQNIAPSDRTYFEILSSRVVKTMHQARHQMGRFKVTSTAHREETQDLAGYMIDYVQEQVAEGLTEEQALEQAMDVFDVDNPNNPLLTNPQYEDWQVNYTTEAEETTNGLGLLYLGRILTGFALGILLDLMLQINDMGPLMDINFVLFGLFGGLLGLGLGMSDHIKILNRHHH